MELTDAYLRCSLKRSYEQQEPSPLAKSSLLLKASLSVRKPYPHEKARASSQVSLAHHSLIFWVMGVSSQAEVRNMMVVL